MKNRGFGKKKAGLLLCLSLLLFTGCGEGQAAGGTGLDSGSAQAEAGGTVQESTPAGTGGMVQNGSAPQEGVPTESGSAVNGSVPQESVPAEAGGSALQESASAEAGGTGADDSITLIMVGDILLHTPVAESGKTKDGEYDFSAIFAPLKEEIQSADIAIVNQEVIIGGAELGVSGYPAFNAPYELGDALVEAGFDVVCQGTNHALDKGKKGILNCISYWREEHPEIAVLGIHDSEEAASSVYIREEDGFRIAILNYTYGTNGIPLPEGMPYAVELLDKERVAADLKEAEEKADFVVVCPHWGTEYRLEQTGEQESWAAFFAENGADLVIGTHPHVVEPVEWVEDTLVYYSLGNFVNWTSGTGEGVKNRMVGAMAQVTIARNDAGEVSIREWAAEPVVCHVESGFGGVTVYPLSEYTEELAAGNEIVKQDGEFSLESCKELAEQVFGIAVE